MFRLFLNLSAADVEMNNTVYSKSDQYLDVAAVTVDKSVK